MDATPELFGAEQHRMSDAINESAKRPTTGQTVSRDDVSLADQMIAMWEQLAQQTTKFVEQAVLL